MTTPPPFLWHHLAHQEWADEKLVFVFLAFEPTYNREEAAERLQRFLARNEIYSYQIYEVTAPYDVLVRAWIPARMPLYKLKEDLRNDHPERQVAHVLEVAEIVHHWPWAGTKEARIGEILTPDDDTLDAGWPARERDRINELQMNNSNGTLSVGLRPVVKACTASTILTRPDYRSGIRFLVLVKVQQPNNWPALKRRLCTLLDDSRDVIRDPSLYRLDDVYQFLIFGQVAQGQGRFHAISKRLVSQINDYAASGGARTYSSFFPIPGFLESRDELRISQAQPAQDQTSAQELLAQQEGQRLEIKGSAFTELHNWIVKGDAPVTSARPTTDAHNAAVNALMRAIASLLNSNGGSIVIGALERSKYGQCPQFMALPAADEQGVHRCCGLEWDYGGGDWDEFARRLRSVIESRFDPVPSTRWVKIRPAKVADKDLCVIDIVLPDEWFWVQVASKGKQTKASRGGRSSKSASLELQFVVRVEGKSEVRRGRAVDDYQRTTLRAPRKAG